MKMRRAMFVPACLVMLLCAFLSSSAEAGESPGTQETVILNTQSYWRIHVSLRPEVFGTAMDARPDPEARRAEKYLPPHQPHSPFPPANWADPDFDDGHWWRDPGPFYSGRDELGSGQRGPDPRCYGYGIPRDLSLICVRGKFAVTDPTQVKDLTFSARYRGGIVVYLNGKEVARGHLAPSRIRLDTVAADYPPEVYNWPGGKIGTWAMFAYKKNFDVFKEQLLARIRKLEAVPLPVKFLRKGTNVLAIEVHRSARRRDVKEPWATVGLSGIELKTTGSRGVVPNVARPSGFQVWNANPMQAVFDVDYGEPNDALRPIRLVGSRGGVFSGQVVISSDKMIKSLQAEMSDLKRSERNGVIPAALTQVRYALPFGQFEAGVERGVNSAGGPSSIPIYPGITVSRLDTLAEMPQPTVPLRHEGHERRFKTRYLAGAVQPVWVTVRVPGDASTGDYQGTLTIRAQGQKPLAVPVHLVVAGFKLPDPVDFQVFVDMIQSPESVALRYGVPLWSDRHFELLGRSFKFLAQLGNKTLYIPVISKTHFGNEESLVRWVRQPDGSYTCDFTHLEKYLEEAEKHNFRPRWLCLHVWDIYCGGDRRGSKLDIPARKVMVSRLDPATGEVELMEGPLYEDPQIIEFFKPFAAGLTAITRKRGMESALILALSGDKRPTKDVVETWKQLLPGTPWASHSHGLYLDLHGVPCGFAGKVYGMSFGVDPDIERTYGWKVEAPVIQACRDYTAQNALAMFRLLPESNIQGKQRGMGRLCADFWPVPLRDARGETHMRTIIGRFGLNHWVNLRLYPNSQWLEPGPKGAVSTVRFEMLREALQECEARIFIEKALLDEEAKAMLGEKLARRCQALLDERTRCNLWGQPGLMYVRLPLPGGQLGPHWFAGSGWQQRSEKLYTAAAEVAARLTAMSAVESNLPKFKALTGKPQ